MAATLLEETRISETVVRVRKEDPRVARYRSDVVVTYTERGVLGTDEFTMSRQTAEILLDQLIDLLVGDPERVCIKRLLCDR